MCGRLESVQPSDPAFAKIEVKPGYKHICHLCNGTAGRDAQTATGLNPQMLDALDRLIGQRTR